MTASGMVRAVTVSRANPAVVTAATTILGMNPLLADAGLVNMAVTTMAGLAVATLLARVTVPVLYGLSFGSRTQIAGSANASG